MKFHERFVISSMLLTRCVTYVCECAFAARFLAPCADASDKYKRVFPDSEPLQVGSKFWDLRDALVSGEQVLL